MSPSQEGGARASRRALWRLLETYHALVYYAPERPVRYARLGLKGGWMGYFATRSAALGMVPAPVVTACFYGFSDAMVRRALPDAWRYTTPADALAARYEVFDAACSRLVGSRASASEVLSVASELGSVVERLSPHGRPMFAAHAQAHRPTEPHLSLFWAATALREYRGDAHITALQSADVGPAASNVLMSALRLTPDDQRSYRGWSEAEWNDAERALEERGWLTSDGSVSREGHKRRADIERVTDQLVAPAWTGMEENAMGRVIDVLGGLVGTVVTAGEVPYPNGMGVPPVPELAVPR
jgi:hypothetical protein